MSLQRIRAASRLLTLKMPERLAQCTMIVLMFQCTAFSAHCHRFCRFVLLLQARLLTDKGSSLALSEVKGEGLRNSIDSNHAQEPWRTTKAT